VKNDLLKVKTDKLNPILEPLRKANPWDVDAKVLQAKIQ
jgi:hypothetical protein